MAEIKSYSLEQCKELVEDAKVRYRWRHQWMKSLELLYRTGRVNPLNETAVTGTIFERLYPADLESINMVLPHVNIILASIIARDPKPVAVPYAGGEIAEKTARIAEAVGQYWWQRINATAVLRDMAQDMVTIGNGFCKVGWKLSEKETPRDPAVIQQEMMDLADTEGQLAAIQDRPVKDITEIHDFVAQTEKIVDQDQPFIEYVSPYDIYVPTNARRLDEARWIAQRITIPADEVRANSSFSNVDSLIIDGQQDFRENELGRLQSQTDDVVYQTVTIYEFYDLRTHTLKVFQLESDVCLYDGEIPYSHAASPYVHMRNYSDGGNEFWAFGDLENIASLQEKLNEVFTEQVDNMRRSGNKYIANMGMFDAISRDKLESDEPDVVIEIDVPQGVSIRDIIMPVPRAPLPSDIYNAQAKMEEAMKQILGINDFQAGGNGADRMSAYAAAVVDGVATLRGKDKQMQVEKAAAKIFDLLIRLCQEYMAEGKVVRLLGESGGVWATVDQETLKGQFDMHIEGGSLSSINPATRQQKALEMLTQVVPTIVQFGYDAEPALRHIVRDLGYDPEMFLKKQEQPPAPAPAPEGQPAPEQMPPEMMGQPAPEQGGIDQQALLDALASQQQALSPTVAELAQQNTPPMLQGLDAMWQQNN